MRRYRGWPLRLVAVGVLSLASGCTWINGSTPEERRQGLRDSFGGPYGVFRSIDSYHLSSNDYAVEERRERGR